MTTHLGASPPFRRTRYAAAALLVAIAVTWVVGRQAGAVNDPGQGTSSAQVLRVDPRAGGLSVGVGLGEALAGHQNEAAKAQSLSLDLGVIGTSLTTSTCASPPTLQPSQLPQVLIVETGQPNADKGVLQSQDGGAFTQFGQALSGPYGKAITKVAPVSVPGLIDIAGGTATSWSGIVNGQRQAGATVDIAGITILGKVTLAGLHWDVLHQSTGTPIHAGSFSIAAIKLGGAALPIPDIVSGLAQANAVLGMLGVQIMPPTVHLTQGIEYVDPLQIAIVPNAARDKVLSTILTAIQPVRKPTFDAVLKAVCKASTPIEVTDIALGAVSGAGSFDIQLGGLRAGTGEVGKNGFDLGLPGVGPLTLPVVSTNSGDASPVSIPDVVSLPPVTQPPVTAPAVTTAPVRGPQQAIKPITAFKGRRGGALAAVALGGLAILALIAEGDRRMMRRAQRKVTFED